MREIRLLKKEEALESVGISFNAYPSFKDFSKESKGKYADIIKDIIDNDEDVHVYGMFDGNKLISIMRLFDFKMNYHGKIVPTSGLGFLGVDLLHKKQGIAREMIGFYEKQYLKREIPIALLLPFRPDFYKSFGYGLGTKMNRYRIKTGRIPAYYEKMNLKFIKDGNEINELLNLNEYMTRRTHGMLFKTKAEIEDIKEADDNLLIGCYDKDGQISGYMIIEFLNGKKDNYTVNHIHVKELIYKDNNSLDQLLGFLRKQEDQVSLVIFDTKDDHFHYKFDNPMSDTMNYVEYGNLETNTQLVGLMYKILDVKMAFEQMKHRNYNNMDLKFKIYIEDDYSNDVKETIINLVNGTSSIGNEYDFSIRLKRSDFSSLFMGSTSVYGLYKLGLINIDRKEYLRDLDLAFYTMEKPICNTDF